MDGKLLLPAATDTAGCVGVGVSGQGVLLSMIGLLDIVPSRCRALSSWCFLTYCLSWTSLLLGRPPPVPLHKTHLRFPLDRPLQSSALISLCHSPASHGFPVNSTSSLCSLAHRWDDPCAPSARAHLFDNDDRHTRLGRSRCFQESRVLLVNPLLSARRVPE